ncbi:ligase-associated DNA damage response exonuclease [Paraburkholderia caribensis]|uniref:DNA ligase-associated DEXH box helicase n=1 Tax=Paraburkholderia caribensis TaxID=75105 RepID=A0A9Q6WPF5_9BURK|nr:ligase-associated DNA damage response exonuclease [Paraburkholderia caribensis]MCO4881694.1 ligase-associated DNA damage response exonuclease [Paraburkholderia caribensis]PTB23897.1 DNA ligase-associated DEXH box helicase [Paraburkholderia caribensis]QLB65824.1 DNA ligase-associated DEXH box helicase [Paraburkholderia caribensis]
MSQQTDLIVARPEGLYCPPGDFHIDPWRPVERAVITHAHADHARFGHRRYLAAEPGALVLQSRLPGIALQTLSYGERITINGVAVSLHPAGHVLGSAQVRVEHRGEVWVASGDYKLDADPTCAPFEPVRCDTFITESTFGLPIYRWDAPQTVFDGIDSWWRHNAATGRASVLFCYSFGKAQHILAGIDAGIGPIFCHGAVDPLNRAYRAAGVALPPVRLVSEIPAKQKEAFRQALVIAPPSAQGSAWLRRFGEYSDAFASGWMRLRGTRRRRGVDRGFVLSDHADWPGLQTAIAATGAQRVIVTHGQVEPMVRWLREQGLEAGAFATEYGDDAIEADAAAASEGEPAMSAGVSTPDVSTPETS